MSFKKAAETWSIVLFLVDITSKCRDAIGAEAAQSTFESGSVVGAIFRYPEEVGDGHEELGPSGWGKFQRVVALVKRQDRQANVRGPSCLIA